MNFQNDLKQLLLEDLKKNGYEIPSTATLFEVVRVHKDLRNRIIQPRPRTVHLSREFQSKLPSLPNLSSIKSILRKASVGEDLNPYQSKRLRDFDYQDELLNDWGVHHLHTSDKVGKGGFNERTSLLLFIVVREKDLYVLDAKDHAPSADAFANLNLLEIIKENWGDKFGIAPLIGVTLPAPSSNEEVLKTRKAGLATLVRLPNGEVYGAVAGGTASDGSSLLVTRQAMFELERIQTWERNIRANEALIRNSIRESLGSDPEELSFELTILGDGSLGILETNYNVRIDVTHSRDTA